MSIRLFFRHLNRLGRLPLTEKSLFAEALFFLFAAKLLLLFIPFRHCIWLLSTEQKAHRPVDMVQLGQLKKAIHRTRWLAFWKNKCLVISVASRWMLQRRHIASLLSLGVTFDENKKLKAHAWLRADEFYITEKDGDYVELFHF